MDTEITRLRTAYLLSVPLLVLLAVASAVGVFVAGFYPDTAWASAAMRGGDLITLVVVVPTLATALVLARRGSVRAELVWAGALGYTVYTYAYVTFGAEFNDLFLAHVAILSLAVWALVALLVRLERTATAALFGPRTPARIVALLLGGTAAVLGGLWGTAIVRQAVTGDPPFADVPLYAQHMVLATDLVVFVSPLVVATVLLWRRTFWGFVGGTVMALSGGLYLLNLMSAAFFQARADVPGVAAFSPGTLILALGYLAATVALLAFPAPVSAIAAVKEPVPVSRVGQS